MDLHSLISRETPICGIDISDNAIRIAFFRKNNKHIPLQLVVDHEILPKGAMLHGKILDRDKIIAALRTLLKKHKEVPAFAVVSISPSSCFIGTLVFPASLAGTRLSEATQLALQWKLPWKEREAYVGTEQHGDNEHHRILVYAAKRASINEYISLLKDAGIKAIALESRTASVARVLPRYAKALVTAIPELNDVVIAVMERGVMSFVRTIPMEYCDTEEKVALELERVKNYYETEHHVIAEITPWATITDTTIAQVRALSEEQNVTTEDYAAIGAATRGMVSRNDDKYASLLPESTESLYAYQRATTFVAFLRNTTIGILIFFVGAYCAVWLFLLSLEINLSTSAINNRPPVSQDELAIETRAKAFNELIGIAGEEVLHSPGWSGFLEQFLMLIPSEITITNLTLTTPEESLSLSGVATNRATLNAFKRTLEQSGMVKNIILPLANLEQKESIPFSMTFMLKTPSSLYLTIQ